MAGPRPSIWDDGCPPPQAAYPGTRTGRPRASPYLALLRVGFTKPARSPGPLVRSYRTVSPLPRLVGAVCFLWHFPEGHPWWTLSTTLPCGARTFLPQTIAARGRAARSGRYFILQRHRLHNRRQADGMARMRLLNPSRRRWRDWRRRRPPCFRRGAHGAPRPNRISPPPPSPAHTAA